MTYLEDGITHINIYSKGQTELGRLLSNFAHTPFVHPEDGLFESVEGYWYWLSCRNDELRKVHGWLAKQMGRQLGGKDWLDTDEFKRKICLAIKTKIESHPHIEKLMKENKLPYKHYYVYADKVIEPKDGRWVVEYIQNLMHL